MRNAQFVWKGSDNTMNQTMPHYFLGSNTGSGFYSLYDSLTDSASGDFLWILKGGPGCGKSTFMKKIGAAAEAAGEMVEYVHCSGDPASLDGVYLPKRRIAYADGTNPHVLEPDYPGASSLYLDFSTFFDTKALSEQLDCIRELNTGYKACYRNAYVLLSAGAALLPKNLPNLCSTEQQVKIEKRAAGIVAKKLPPLKKCPRIKRRFLSAWSCVGKISFAENLMREAAQIYLLDSRLGFSRFFLAYLAASAADRGYDTVLYSDPLEPEKPEAVYIPEVQLLFLAQEGEKGIGTEHIRHIRLDLLAERSRQEEIRARRNQSRLLLEAAVNSLNKAKALHDELEALYCPHINFSGVEQLTEDHIQWLFG